eukprot:2994905-Pleurochrysis_carterae.AAC.1
MRRRRPPRRARLAAQPVQRAARVLKNLSRPALRRRKSSGRHVARHGTSRRFEHALCLTTMGMATQRIGGWEVARREGR